MIRLLRWAATGVVSLVLLWAFFYVPVGGGRTLWEHTRRIAGTPEARDLGHDLDRARIDVANKVRDEVIPTLVATGDAGARDASRAVPPTRRSW